MRVFIKNMVCHRCILAVEQILNDLKIRFTSIKLGEIQIAENTSTARINAFSARLNAIGFEIISDKKSRIIEKIKNLTIGFIHYQKENPPINLSRFLSEKMRYDYHYLSKIFSETEGTTIEKFFIAQKIEKVKELIVYDELTLSEISYQLGYSSVAYLCNQFKKVTGLTPGHFKEIKSEKRKPLDKV